MARDRDWEPRSLSGGIYCSPACGGTKGWCKRADFDKAHKDAAALAARMGEGWEVRVWENLGWHWEVAKGAFEIHPPHKDGKYSAWFQGAKQFIAYADTPEDALGFVTQDARTFMRRMEDEFKSAA